MVCSNNVSILRHFWDIAIFCSVYDFLWPVTFSRPLVSIPQFKLQATHAFIINTRHVSAVKKGFKNLKWPSLVLIPLVFYCGYISILCHSRYTVTYLPKFKEVTWPWTHHRWSNLLCIRWYSSRSICAPNLKCLASFIVSKDMIGLMITRNRGSAACSYI